MTTGVVEKLLLAALILGLAWAPAWLGSNRAIAWGVNGILFPGLVIAYELSRIVLGRPHAVAARYLSVPIGLFIGVVAWILLQISPWTPPTLVHPIWPLAAQALGEPVPGSISVDPGASVLGLLRLITDASVFWLALQLCRSAPRAHLLLHAIMAIIAVYAALGLYLAVFEASSIPYLDGPAPGLVRSTFINRNSLAAYAGIGVIIALTLWLRALRAASATGSHQPGRFLRLIAQFHWIEIGAGLLALGALMATGSRGGVIATAAGLACVLVLTFPRSDGSILQRISVLLVPLLALGGAVVFMGDVVFGRIAASGLTDTSRAAVNDIMIRSLQDAPLSGFGYGTFTDIFPVYRDQSISTTGVWDKAHNTYLEVLQGLGLVFGTMMIALVAWLVGLCVVGAFRRRRHRAPLICAVGTGILLGVHALVDFSLQIQAISLTFMALLGAGVSQWASSSVNLSDGTLS
ncbi:O-antigen ligase family protein [Labrys sp. 22185]|uniref:O-antigen ligase family protein n=1 Tax=Labrys sp. 22185 TaxID=3453888 RepID=UPI003F859A55